MSSFSKPRRDALRALAAAITAAGLGAGSPSVLAEDEDRGTSARAALKALEADQGGRLGVFVVDSRDGSFVDWRADERFGLCSTFKLLLAGVLMREAQSGRLDLGELIEFSDADRVAHAPVTGPLLESGGGRAQLSIAALAEATQKTSDNPAANLLIARLGGPQRLTALLRELGDPSTRIDRIEPEMNLVPPGEPRDTTTPRAMANSAARLLIGDGLQAEHRERLLQWTIDTRTGLRRIRAGLPSDWLAGDKTGTGLHESMANKHNDVAILWPPGRAPIVVAAYYEADAHYPSMRAQDDAVLAEVGRIVARWAG